MFLGVLVLCFDKGFASGNNFFLGQVIYTLHFLNDLSHKDWSFILKDNTLPCSDSNYYQQIQGNAAGCIIPMDIMQKIYALTENRSR